MKWWKWKRPFVQKEQKLSEINDEVETLCKEIREAHRDWVNAQHHFEYSLGKDQVDYAVFAIEAAEKRYEMLLRHAKSLSVSWPAQRGEDAG